MTGAIVWLTGLPGAGKSTLGVRLARRLRDLGRPTLLLDGDEVRAAILPAHGYDDASRDAFYRTLGNLAALAARQDLVVVVPATAHRRLWRDLARARAPRFVEVHVATPIEECRRRDPKGLYARGVLPPYEAPEAPDVVAPAGDDPQIVERIIALL